MVASKPPLAITHAPGHMLITDIPDRQYRTAGLTRGWDLGSAAAEVQPEERRQPGVRQFRLSSARG